MSFKSSFKRVLLSLFLLATLTPGHTTEGILGSDGDDVLHGSNGHDLLHGDNGDDQLHGGDGDDELRGGNGHDLLHGDNGNDQLHGGNGDDKLHGGDGDDELRGGNGDDVLYGGIGIDRLYGGLGADRFVFDINAMEADEVMDFNPDQNDTVWLQNKYTEMSTDTALTADDVRVDEEGGVEVRIANNAWTRIVGLNHGNLHVSTREVTGALQLHFTRQF